MVSDAAEVEPREGGAIGKGRDIGDVSAALEVGLRRLKEMLWIWAADVLPQRLVVVKNVHGGAVIFGALFKHGPEL